MHTMSTEAHITKFITLLSGIFDSDWSVWLTAHLGTLFPVYLCSCFVFVVSTSKLIEYQLSNNFMFFYLFFYVFMYSIIHLFLK